MEPGLGNLYAITFVIILGIASITALRSAITDLPATATTVGQDDADVLRRLLQSDKCIRCAAYGPKSIVGISLITDNRAVYIGKHSGGVVRMPLDGFEYSFRDAVAEQ